MKYKIYNQDVIEWAKEYQKGKFHALISDTPYHLTSIVKRFGKKGSAPAKHGTDGVFSRSSKGFMGQQWDGGDVAFRPETWEALGEHLYPGAFGMCFSASRNWHRLAVAIEDAGMIIHPTIFGWLNGQGFPKATNISKQLDKGKEGKVIGKKKLWGHNAGSGAGSFSKNQYEGHAGEVRYEDIHAPASELSETWQGHRYGLQALKPAVEPIIVFQKPYEGKPLDNIVETGAGAINIDGGRIPLNGDSYTINTFDAGAKPWGDAKGEKFTSHKVEILSNHSRSAKSSKSKGIYGDIKEQETHQTLGQQIGRWPANFLMSEGVWDAPESRFFYNVQEQIDEADPIYYCGKVSPKERNAGLDDFEYVNYAVSDGARKQIERGEDGYLQDSIGINRVHKVKNPHPTLKPIALAKYLATLLLPPIEYAPRRILVPFSGVASEMVGCALAGWEHIVGIEFDTENGYVDLAHKRMEYWSSK